MGQVHVSSAHCARRELRSVELLPEDGFELCIVQSGSFALSSSRHDVLVDPVTSVFGAPTDEGVQVAHPYGSGEEYTVIVLGAQVLDQVAGGTLGTPAVAHLGAAELRLHLQLLGYLRLDEQAAVEELAVVLFSRALAQSEPARVRSGQPSVRRRAQLVDDARAIVAADPSIESIVTVAYALNCSSYHLSRTFRAATGMTLSAYRRQVRVNNALNLLAGGGYSLAEVAARTGFADHGHLTRSVRAVLGATPSAVRRELHPPTPLKVD